MKKETKETYTYATLPSVKKKAQHKAFMEGKSLSEKIDNWLRGYIKPTKKKKPVKPNWSKNIDDTTYEAMNG